MAEPKDLQAVIDDIARLRQQIEQWNYEYYIAIKPSVTDEMYDLAYRELTQLEQQYPNLQAGHSPTMRVGSIGQSDLPKITHPLPMLSLINAMNETEIEQWLHRTERHYYKEKEQELFDQSVALVVEPKLDGLALSARYVNGLLKYVATRGDGQIGEDVTSQAKMMPTLPLKLLGKVPADVEIRMECFQPRDAFETMNQQARQDNTKVFSNPRNAAAGTIRQLDTKKVAQRNLRYYCYSADILSAETDFQFKNHWQILAQISKWGLAVNPENTLIECKDLLTAQQKITQLYHTYIGKREHLDYDIDGMVVKVSQLLTRKHLGQVAKAPRWAIACKFPHIEKITTLEKVTYQVGRTGQVTPVANLTPIEIAGVQVSFATLHNIDEMQRLQLREGDRVVVRRAGDVIPQILDRIDDPAQNQQPLLCAPTICPCNLKQPLTRRKNILDQSEQSALQCNYQYCKLQNLARLEHFVSIKALDIRSLGPSKLEIFTNLGMVGSVDSIFFLARHRSIILSLPRFGKLSVEKMLKAIDRVRATLPQHRWLFALGIPGIGSVLSEKISHQLSLEQMLAMDESAWLALDIDDFGPTLKQSAARWFAMNRDLVTRILAIASFTKPAEAMVKSTVLAGHTVVVTGSFANFTRTSAQEAIKSLGGKVKTSVSKESTLLLAGDKAGSKLQKATSLGIEIVDEDYLNQLLSNNNND